MRTITSSQKTVPLWRSNVVSLALLSALFGAFMAALDTFVINKPFLGVDSVTAGYAFTSDELRANVFAYLFLGSWVGLLANLIFNRLFGRVLDKSFTRETFISVKAQIPMFVTGSLAAVFTFTQIFVATGGDPSYLIALSNFAIVYIVLYEGFGRRNLGMKLLFGVTSLLGSILVSVETLGLGLLSFSWKVVFLMVVVVGGTMAISRLIERSYTERGGGQVNFAFWRFFWLAVISTIVAPIVTLLTGTFPQFVGVITTKFLVALPYIVVTMFFAYGANLLRISAQINGGEYNTGRVAVLLCTTAAFSLPITILAKTLFPAIYTIPNDPWVWVIRGLGTIFIVVGVISLEKLKE